MEKLTDQEEMVISLVHPSVHVYTLLQEGQLAHAGHVCNFGQNVAGAFSSLPVLPEEVSSVMVRPRCFRNRRITGRCCAR